MNALYRKPGGTAGNKAPTPKPPRSMGASSALGAYDRAVSSAYGMPSGPTKPGPRRTLYRS